jgi:hypothetical protein
VTGTEQPSSVVFDEAIEFGCLRRQITLTAHGDTVAESALRLFTLGRRA